MKRLLVFLLLSLILSGCSDGGSFKVKSAKAGDPEKQQLEDILKDDKRLVDGVGYIMDGELVAAGKVKIFSKFKKTKIEGDVQKKLKEAFPDHDVIFSTDLKIFWEIEELKEDQSDKKMKKRLQKIQSLSKEET